MILVVSSGQDEHAQRVLAHLRAVGADATLLDLSAFPSRMAMSLKYGDRTVDWTLRLPSGKRLDLQRCGSVWWRRPQPFQLHPEIRRENYQRFALTECHEAFTGLWQGLEAFWVNPPAKDEAAHRKAYQLSLAQQIGLKIPKTLITSEPEDAKAFIDRHGADRTVYKAFSATPSDWRETRLLKPQELSLIDNVKMAPVIFQEYIEAEFDLRITVVGSEVFAAAIYSQQTSYKVDYRMDFHNARIDTAEVPENVKTGLTALMKRLGLIYGAIDMRKTPEGEYVFLEINPAGQWLFVEQATKQPIASCLAELLAEKDVV